MNRFTTISNSELAAVIDNRVKGERDRKLMKRRLIDCIKLEALAEEFDLSVKQAHRITIKYSDYLYSLCNEWATINCT